MEQLVVMTSGQVEELMERTIKRVMEDMDAAPLDVKGAAKFTTLSTSTIYSMVNDKKIPHDYIGSRLIFYKHELRPWLKER